MAPDGAGYQPICKSIMNSVDSPVNRTMPERCVSDRRTPKLMTFLAGPPSCPAYRAGTNSLADTQTAADWATVLL